MCHAVSVRTILQGNTMEYSPATDVLDFLSGQSDVIDNMCVNLDLKTTALWTKHIVTSVGHVGSASASKWA